MPTFRASNTPQGRRNTNEPLRKRDAETQRAEIKKQADELSAKSSDGQPPKKRKLNLDDLVASFKKSTGCDEDEPREKETVPKARSLQELKAEADERMQSLLQFGRKNVTKVKEDTMAEATGQAAHTKDEAQKQQTGADPQSPPGEDMPDTAKAAMMERILQKVSARPDRQADVQLLQQKLDLKMLEQQRAQEKAQQEAQQEVSVLDEMKRRTQKAMEARKQMLGGAEPKSKGIRQGQASEPSNLFAKSKPSSPPAGPAMSSSHLAVEEQTSGQETASPLSNIVGSDGRVVGKIVRPAGQVLPSESSGSLEEHRGFAVQQASPPERSLREMTVELLKKEEAPTLAGLASKPTSSKRRRSPQEIVEAVQKSKQEIIQVFEELTTHMRSISRSPQMIVAEVQRKRLEVLMACTEQTTAASTMAGFVQNVAQAGQQPQGAQGGRQDQSSWKKAGWKDSGWKDSGWKDSSWKDDESSSWKDRGWREPEAPKELEIWDGDWMCPMCKSLVFGWRDECSKCGVPKALGLPPEMSSDFNK